MAEQYHEDPAAPQNPPNSVLNRRVRRGTFWLYLGPLVALFAAVGFAIFYLTTRPPDRGAQGEKVWNATGTTGEIKPGGHSPDPVPERPEKDNRVGRYRARTCATGRPSWLWRDPTSVERVALDERRGCGVFAVNGANGTCDQAATICCGVSPSVTVAPVMSACQSPNAPGSASHAESRGA